MLESVLVLVNILKQRIHFQVESVFYHDQFRNQSYHEKNRLKEILPRFRISPAKDTSNNHSPP